MFSVALIGPDGAGKSTLARMLEERFHPPVKTLYMGVNIGSSNVMLPLARWIENLKQRKREEHAGAPSTPRRKRLLWRMLRLVYRLSEEWYRQWVAWQHRRQGFIVIYDRYYPFDFAYHAAGDTLHFDERWHRWLLENCYPRPDLVLYLDAPAEVLFARKGEGTLASLEQRRQAFLREGDWHPAFVCIDATQPLEQVYAAVAAEITRKHHALSGAGLHPAPAFPGSGGHHG